MTPLDPRPPVVLALVGDDGFAMPMAVACRSVIDTLASGRRIEIFIVGVDLPEDSWDRLSASCEGANATMHRIDADPDRFASLPESPLITRATYQRLMLPTLLSGHDKVLYIDGDVLARRDVSDLFDIDMAGAAAAGVRDFDWWYLSNDTRDGIPGFETLGLDPAAPYVNAGVLLLSLDEWRRHDIAERAVEFLTTSATVREVDQDGVNVALAGRVMLVDPRWNVQVQVTRPDWPARVPAGADSPFPPALVRTLRRDPWVVHFTHRRKPWRADCDHPLQREWLQVMARTAWAAEGPPAVSSWSVWRRRARLRARILRHRLRAWRASATT